jgi:hypothetical protein
VQTSQLNGAASERAIQEKAKTLKTKGLNQPAVIKQMAEAGFRVWEDRVLRQVAIGLGEARLDASNWVAHVRSLGWVPEAPKADDGNGRVADEEVNDQIGREADDSKKWDAQASEIPMEAKKNPEQELGGKDNNNSEADGSASEVKRTAKSNGADHEIDERGGIAPLVAEDDHEIDDTDADLAVFDHEPELEAAKAPPSAAIALAQAESDAIRDGADEHGGALPDALWPLAEQTRWVLWRWEKNQKGKDTKVPYQPNGKKASSTAPKTWSSFASVWAAREKFDGIGFCLLDSGYGVFDLDDCRDATTGTIAPWAKELVARAGSYTEITISDTGLRIIGHAGGPKIHRKQPVTNGSTLETYRRAERYVVMTGNVLPGTPQVLANIDSVMEEVVAELDGKKQSKANGHGGDKDELPPKLASILCVEGSGGYPSRSELLFAFLAEALRKKIKAEAIADACVDEKYRGFGIFEHCRENDEGREYVLRQIEHALEKVVPAEDSDDPLNEMNERFAVVMIGGKARVLTWEASPFDQCWKIPVYLPRNDFRFLQDKWRVIYVDAEGETQKVPRGSWWLSHPARRQYDSVVFVPGKDVPGKLNLWNGWACEPRPGDCGLYLAHLKDNICSGDDSCYQYLLSWMAYAVQQPARQGEVAVVLRGGEVTGKGFAVKRFGRLFGPHFLPVTNTRHLTGNFNVHLQQCCVLFGDEAFYAGDRQHEGILKVLVTEESLTIEPKGVDIFLVPNYLHVVLSSNNEWVVPASFDARRWFVLDVSDAQKQNTDYFGKIDDQMFAGGQGTACGPPRSPTLNGAKSSWAARPHFMSGGSRTASRPFTHCGAMRSAHCASCGGSSPTRPSYSRPSAAAHSRRPP